MSEKAKPKLKPKPKQSTTKTKVADKNPVAKDKPVSKPKSRFGFFKLLCAIILMVFLVAVSVTGFLFWKDWQIQTEIIEKNRLIVNSLKSSIGVAEGKTQSALKQLRAQQRVTEGLEDQLQTIELRLNAQGRRLVELGSTSRSDWLLAEAEYLARLAKQRLQTERSVKSPLALLNSVDAILTEIDDPNLLEVRSAVAADITSLRLVSDVDREGVYLELQALANNIETLSLVELVEPLEEPSQSRDELAEVEDQTILAEFLSDLSGLIRVRQREKPIEPILRPQEEQIVRRNMQMIFEQAQIALLREEPNIYRDTLEKAQNYLQRFFQSNPSSEAVSERLKVLLETPIVQRLPEIYGSLEAIQTLMIVREQRLLDNTATEQSESVQ